MTTITIDRAAVEQALEALGCVDLQFLVPDYGSGHYSVDRLDGPQVESAITALRSALMADLRAAMAQEQEPEPIKHEHQWFRTGGMEPGQMRCIHCGKWGKETFDE